MANTKSAKKRAAKSVLQREKNRAIRTRMRTAVKKVRVAAAQTVPLDLCHRHIYVIRPRQVTRRTDEGVVVQYVDDAGDLNQHVILGDRRLAGRRVGAALASAAPTVPEPAAATPAPTALLIVLVALASIAAKKVREL